MNATHAYNNIMRSIRKTIEITISNGVCKKDALLMCVVMIEHDLKCEIYDDGGYMKEATEKVYNELKSEYDNFN